MKSLRKTSLPSMNFKTGHFALRREESIVKRFRNQKLSLSTKRKLSILLNFLFPFVSLNGVVLTLKCELWS